MELRPQSQKAFSQSWPVVPCAQCGDALFAPEWSEYLDPRSVRHLWSCDSCGYRFESWVRYPEPRQEAA